MKRNFRVDWQNDNVAMSSTIEAEDAQQALFLVGQRQGSACSHSVEVTDLGPIYDEGIYLDQFLRPLWRKGDKWYVWRTDKALWVEFVPSPQPIEPLYIGKVEL